MKTLILAFAVLVGGTAMAQQHEKREHKTAEERAGISAQRMKTELGLDDAQTAKIQDIHLDMAKKSEAVRSNTALSKEEKMTQFKDIRNSRHVQYKEVLTPEQYAKYEALQKERHEKMKAKRSEFHHHKGEKGKKCQHSEEKK